MTKVLENQRAITEENVNLRKALAEAIYKGEKHKQDLEEQKEICKDFAEKVGEYEEKMGKMADELNDLEDAVDEKDGLISYLQSQINVKQMPKVGRRSTLLKTISDVSLLSVSPCLDRSDTCL